jgi:type IV pilus assembly protein PilA
MKMNKKGFTLIELLIVVAIIAILAAIAIPQFGAYRARAVRASMVADSKNIATGIETMNQDCSSYLPANGFKMTGPVGANLIQTPADCISNTQILPAGYPAAATKGNVVSITSTSTTWSMTVTNTGGNDSSFTGPVTRVNTGACSWNIGGGC